MARKNANTSPGVWLGLLLVLVVHALVDSAHVKEVSEQKGFPENEDNDYEKTIPSKEGSAAKLWDLDDASRDPNKLYKSVRDETKDLNDEKRRSQYSGNASELNNERIASLDDNAKKSNVNEITTTEQTGHDHFTLRENEPIPTITTIDLEKRLTVNVGAEETENTKETTEFHGLVTRVNKTNDTTVEERQREVGHDSVGKLSTTGYEEFNIAEEHDNFEDHTVSEFAEATTQSNNHHASDSGTISLANDINVNNGTNISIGNNGVGLGNEPKHEVERFNVTDISTLRITEQTGREIVDDDTTPQYSSSSRPKGRTISNTGDNDLSTKKPNSFNYSDVDQSASVTIRRIVPKKPTSTGKPYPYLHAESNFTVTEFGTENLNKTDESSTDGISTYENIIGRQTSGENIVEPSLLGENSIHQFKPVHNKRSGNSSRVNSTLDNPVVSTGWSLATTEDLPLKNETEIIEESRTTISDNGNRSHINNDVPQDNPNNSFTTIRSPVILSEVPENNIETGIGTINNTYNLTASTPISKKLTERSEITAESIALETQASNSTERIETRTNGSSTSNDIQTGIEDSSVTLNQLNVTQGSTEPVISRKDVSISTEIYTAGGASDTTEKLDLETETTTSLPVTISTVAEGVLELSTSTPTSETTKAKSIEEKVTNITEFETSPGIRETTRSITESTVTQTTNVQYEFIELTTPGSNTTISQDEVTSLEKSRTVTDFENVTPQTTESQEVGTTDSSVEQNETMVSKKVETTDSETLPVSTTLIFDTTTTSDNISEATTGEKVSNTTNSPISESSFTTVTDVFTDTTLPSTFYDKSSFHGRVDNMTSGQTSDTEETTTMISTETIIFPEETTTVSNIEVIPSSESTSASENFTTVTQSTTLQIHSTTELPEFVTSNDDITLFVRVVIEGSWTDVCPLLSHLRQLMANLLTEGTDRTARSRNIILHQTQCSAEATSTATLTQVVLYVVDDDGQFDYTMTELVPSLYKASPFEFPLPIRSVEKRAPTESANNAIAVIAVSSVAFICLVLLAGLLFIMRKRQTRFNYGERCRPVSLDAFRLDSVSAYNSVRRKGLTRASKRSYGNPAFEDSSVTPTHPLNFAGLSTFCNESNAITEEFEGIPQVTARMDELPAGAEVKNRYANVAPLPETRVLLQKINNEPLTEYINASYVRGPKNATKYYIACQAPMESTVSDFWRMIWEQQSKVIIMLTDIVENGVEKCVEYIPPSEVTDCHRLYGDYQVTLKKREAKEKYAISTLHLKNLENNTYREVSHIWYLWPTNGVPSNGTGLIAILLEARALQRGAPGPIVIHCSPGTGRTGTLIALDLGIRQYEITRTVDVPRVVYTIRRDRAGAVQTKEQYAFIYKALNLYAAKLAGGALESM